jgi:hypothetical protein
MLIEYKIKFEQDGVTITQRVEPDDSANAPVVQNTPGAGLFGHSLGKVFGSHAGALASGGEAGPTGPGGEAGATGPGGEAGPTGPGGSKPGNLFGSGSGVAANPLASGGEAGPTGPGGTGTNGRPIIILGPIVVGGPTHTQAATVPPMKTGKDWAPEKGVRRPALE